VSARRQARGHDPIGGVVSAGGVPRALAVGKCIEVWSAVDSHFPHWSAMRRYSAARQAWLEVAGIADQESWQFIADGAPWSVEYIGPQRAQERLAGVDVNIRDVPRLRSEAQRLLEGI
jgi:hypothetical protein